MATLGSPRVTVKPCYQRRKMVRCTPPDIPRHPHTLQPRLLTPPRRPPVMIMMAEKTSWQLPLQLYRTMTTMASTLPTPLLTTAPLRYVCNCVTIQCIANQQLLSVLDRQASSLSAFEQQMLDEHNRLRALHGSPPLIWCNIRAADAQRAANRSAEKNKITKCHDEDQGQNVSSTSQSLLVGLYLISRYQLGLLDMLLTASRGGSGL